MVWIVDGTRRKRDFKHFIEAFEYNNIWRIGENSSLWVLEYGHNYLPKEWQHSQVPVMFDFKGLLDRNEEGYDIVSKRNPLWCLLPITGQNMNVLFKFDRNKLVEMVKGGGFVFKYQEIIKIVNQAIQYRHYYRRRLGYYY